MSLKKKLNLLGALLIFCLPALVFASNSTRHDHKINYKLTNNTVCENGKHCVIRELQCGIVGSEHNIRIPNLHIGTLNEKTLGDKGITKTGWMTDNHINNGNTYQIRCSARVILGPRAEQNPSVSLITRPKAFSKEVHTVALIISGNYKDGKSSFKMGYPSGGGPAIR